jgi:CheY-like chemotaxis protein
MGREGRNSGVSKPQLRVLLVEDDPVERYLILRELAKGEFDIKSEVVQTAEEFRERVRTNCPDVVLSDYTWDSGGERKPSIFCVKKAWTSL